MITNWTSVPFFSNYDLSAFLVCNSADGVVICRWRPRRCVCLRGLFYSTNSRPAIQHKFI